MELFAIAYVCKRFGVPWRAFKYITDSADDFAHEQWLANAADGADLVLDRLFVKRICASIFSLGAPHRGRGTVWAEEGPRTGGGDCGRKATTVHRPPRPCRFR